MPAPRAKHELEIDGRKVAVANLDKVLFQAVSTRAVIVYYIRVSGYLLPHVKDRPVTLKRYPDGVRGAHFYEKNAPDYTPEWVPTFPVRRSGESDMHYSLINDLPGLVWSANTANLEIHPFLARAPQIDQPSFVVFDLDPGECADLLDCAGVALLLRDGLGSIRLEAFPKVSGSKGIQVYAPLNTPVTYAATQRATAGTPYVPMPVTWEELRKAVRRPDCGSQYFAPAEGLKRLDKTGDLFAPVLSMKQKLSRLARMLRKRDVSERMKSASVAVRRTSSGWWCSASRYRRPGSAKIAS